MACNTDPGRTGVRRWAGILTTQGNDMLSELRKLLADENGATAVEYGMLTAMVSIACIAALRAIGTAEVGLYETILAVVFNATADSLGENGVQ